MTTDTQRTCVLDVETRSAVDLRKTNAVVYAKHSTTDVWMARYAYDDDPDTILAWYPGDPMPDDLRRHIEAGGTLSAHNTGFELAIWSHLLAPRYGWCELPLTQCDDTAARAARCGLPRSLEKAADAANIPQKKDTKGAAQMKRMAKPRKTHVLSVEGGMDEGAVAMVAEYEADPRTYTVIWDGDEATVYEWWNTPDRVQRLDDYCAQDIRTQMALHLTLPLLPDSEWEIWQATMRANVRGCMIDVPFVRSAMAIVQDKLRSYATELLTLTDGQVKSHTDLNGMKAWLRRQGVEVDSLDKNAVAALQADASLPASVRRVVSIRAEAGKSSVAKYPAMANHSDENSIAYDALVYYGATATGRWSGSGIQLQNLPARGGVGHEAAEWHVANTLENGANEGADMMELLEDGSAIETLSMCLRGSIRARPEHDIVCADFSNIEGRDAAWLGGEQWKLDAFRAFDAGDGPDLYKVAAGGILGIAPEDVPKPMRNSIGKVSELALQFGGGVGAFLSMAAVYGVEIADYWDEIRAALDARIIEEALEAWESFGKTSGTDKKTWTAAESVKRAWREKHPGIVQAWFDCEDSAINALRNPGKVYYACDGRLAFLGRSMFGKPFLLMRLPSGRCIHYANAHLRDRKTPWGAVKSQVIFDKVEQGRAMRASTYGGDLFQSCLKKGTLVLTDSGWAPIESVSSTDKVWDGQEWVSTDGACYMGRKPTVCLSGVELTEDHEVLTDEGWKAASSCPGHNRAESGLPDCFAVCGFGWQEIPVVGTLRMRDGEEVPCYGPGERAKTRLCDVLRLPAVGHDKQAPNSPRHVPPSYLRRMGQHAVSLLPVKRLQLPQLRRQGYRYLQAVARFFSELSGRYGPFFHVRSDAGTAGRERPLLAGELRLATVENTASKQAQQRQPGWKDCSGGVPGNRHLAQYALLSTEARLPTRTVHGSTVPGERLSPVYDLVNCGPRHRFVIRDGNGRPLIVHNCVQGSARDIMANGWLAAERGGYAPLFSVHDELASEYAAGKANLREYESLLCALPDWAAGMPVTAEGYVASRFRKD